MVKPAKATETGGIGVNEWGEGACWPRARGAQGKGAVGARVAAASTPVYEAESGGR